MTKILIDNSSNAKNKSFTILKIHLYVNSKESELGPRRLSNLMKNKTLDLKTSQITPYEFINYYNNERDDELLVLLLSSKLSGTYNSALLAAKNTRKKLLIIDSKTVSLSLTFLAEKALRLIKEGVNSERIVDALLKTETGFFGIPLDMTYLVKSGRLNPALAQLGKMTGFTILLGLKEGEIKLLAPPLKLSDRVKYLLDYTKKIVPKSKVERIGVVHSLADKSDIECLKKGLHDYYKIKVEVDILSSCLLSHLGPSGLAVAYILKS